MSDRRYQTPLNSVGVVDLPVLMQWAMRAVQNELPAGTGVIVFAFDFGQGGGLAYISNAQREDCIAALEEWIRKQRAESN